MTNTPTGRNRRAAQHQKPEPIAPVSKPRQSQTVRQPIGRSEELLRRQEQMRADSAGAASRHAAQMGQTVRSSRTLPDYSDFDEPALHSVRAPQPKKKRKHDGHTGLWFLVAMVCLLCTGMIAMFALPQLTGIQYANMPNFAFANGSIIHLDRDTVNAHETYKQFMAGDRIYEGIYIDGVHVGGMTQQEAINAVNATGQVAGSSFVISVSGLGYTWNIDSNSVPLYRNTAEVVELAYSLGRGNSTAIRGTGVTPFRQRLNTVLALYQQPTAFYTQMSYDHDAVRSLTSGIAASINRDPVNASVAQFDMNTRTFSFNSDQSGLYIDPEYLYQQVISRLDSGVYYDTVYFEPQVLLASVTKAELMNSFTRIASYTTETTSNSNRNTNVDLSAQAISCTTVLPGETFSFNQATGQRTAEKGYKEATAISGGQSVPEIGGGVCQTSSTLFNAVARANLEIVDRSPHAWPSTYVPKGMDATVNWPNLDFKFRNNTEWPIFIVASYKSRKVTVEIYGMTLGDGITIDLESKVTKTIDPPDEPKYVQNTNLAPGTEEVTIKARTGYQVETYKVVYQNGEEISRELLCKSTYRAYQETIEWN